jgi:hypothetical protein
MQRVMARRWSVVPMRVRAMLMLNDGRSDVEKCHGLVSVRTVQRLRKRQREEQHYEPREGGAWHRGRLPALSAMACVSLFRLVCCCPGVHRRGMQLFLFAACAQFVSLEQISRELGRMGITRKKMRFWSGRRDEQSRANYWIQGPFAGAGIVAGVHGQRNFAGVAGVPVQFMIDIDEASYYVQDANPANGYAPSGCPAIMRGYGKRDGQKITVLLATDVNVGTVASWTFVGNTTNARFLTFLALFLFPAIAGQRRCILFDNLSGHFGANIDALFAACGHAYVARPVHSPDFGFIEWSFNWIRMYLQSNAHHINMLYLQAWIDTACAAITPGLVQGFAVDAHYYVPGRNYRPYIH